MIAKSNKMRFVIAFLLAYCVLLPARASGEPYKPLFVVDMPYEKDTSAERYMRAYRSPTRKIAIREWEVFLAENSPPEPASFEDATDLLLIRQAHYELARLYYLSGNVSAGDKLLVGVDELVAYEVPDRKAAKRWCEVRGYCKGMPESFALHHG